MVDKTPMPTLADLQEAHERFREVMTDTLERATEYLRDRADDGVTDEDDDALLRECETVLEWAKQVTQASGGTEREDGREAPQSDAIAKHEHT